MGEWKKSKLRLNPAWAELGKKLYSLLENIKSHCKMENLFFTKLKLQKNIYLENMNQIEAQTISSYRTWMCNFGENYRGVGGPSIGPFVKTTQTAKNGDINGDKPI